MRKTHSMFYAYLQCSVASVLPRGMGLSPGFYFIFYFFGSLEREPSLWENTWPWEILRTWEHFPGIRLGNQDLWGGEKESTFDTGRRVETGTYHWEGRKPFVQTFDSRVKSRETSNEGRSDFQALSQQQPWHPHNCFPLNHVKSSCGRQLVHIFRISGHV